MLFAEAADDRASFAKIWGWTRDNLQRRDNALFSWRFDPADDKTPVADNNDASDGDILISWALIRAGNRWHESEYTQAAHRVVDEIRRRLLVSSSGKLLLLPGATGFKGKDGVTSSTRPITFIRLSMTSLGSSRRRNGSGSAATGWGCSPRRASGDGA